MVAALAKFAWMGPPGKMKTALGMVQSECLWDLAAGRLNTLMVGASASGKDCATDVARRLVERLQESERIVFSSVVSQGSITLAGCLRKLKEHGKCLVFIQPELEKRVCKRKEQLLQESDLIEVLDPGLVGRLTSQDTRCERPHVLALLGAQPAIYLKELSSENMARLRLQVLWLDETPVNSGFQDEPKKRDESEKFIYLMLRAILEHQHPVSEETARLR